MLDFLRRLAPLDLQAATPARALLPSRMAAGAGLLGTGPDSMSAEAGLTDATPRAGLSLTDPMAPGAPAAHHPSVDASSAGALAAQPAGLPARASRSAAPGQATAAHPASADRTTAAATTEPTALGGAARGLPAHDRLALAFRPARAGIGEQIASPAAAGPAGPGDAPGSTATARPGGLPPTPAGARPQARAHARSPTQDPAAADALSGLLSRGNRPGPAPVIHVHIDRIDVRAPQPPARPAGVPRPRAVAPSVSLADYLRNGATARQGGAS